jgi:hypothetical protein
MKIQAAYKVQRNKTIASPPPVYTIKHLKSKTYYGLPINETDHDTQHHGHNLLLFKTRSSASYVAKFMESNQQPMDMVDVGVLVLSAPDDIVYTSETFQVEESSLGDILSMCKGSGVVPGYFLWTEDPSRGVTSFEVVHLPDQGTTCDNVNHLAKCLKRSGRRVRSTVKSGMVWFLMLLLHIIQ